MGISSLLSCWDTIFFEGFHFIFLFWGGYLQTTKWKPNWSSHLWSEVSHVTAGQVYHVVLPVNFTRVEFPKLYPNHPDIKKKTSKLYNVGWKLHHSSMCMSIPHLKNWWISFQPGKSTGLMTFPRLHVLNSTKLVGGGLADFRMTKIRFHHD